MSLIFHFSGLKSSVGRNVSLKFQYYGLMVSEEDCVTHFSLFWASEFRREEFVTKISVLWSLGF